jgi:hypothetical protein
MQSSYVASSVSERGLAPAQSTVATIEFDKMLNTVRHSQATQATLHRIVLPLTPLWPTSHNDERNDTLYVEVRTLWCAVLRNVGASA